MYRVKVHFVGEGVHARDSTILDTGSFITQLPVDPEEWIGIIEAIASAFLDEQSREYLRDLI